VLKAIPAPTLTNHPVDVGLRTEGAILGALVRRGYLVLVPFGQNQRYDLVLDMDGKFVRVQCKTGRLRNGCVVFSAQSVRSNTRKAVFRHYKDDVELFLVHCPDTGGIYAIPIEEVTRSHGTLRIDPTSNGQEKYVRWARDYELPE
jgi:hypothetical protein